MELSEKHDATPWPWLAFLAAAMIGLLAWLRPRRGAMALALWLGLVWPTFGLFAWPDMNDSRSPRDLMRHVVEITGEDARLAVHDFGEEFLLQTRQPTVHFSYHSQDAQEALRAFHWLKQAPTERWLLIAQEHDSLIECMDRSEAHDLGFQNSQHWWLFPGTAAENCDGDAQAAPVFVAPTSLRRSPYL
jgi:hypothetical protein